MVADSLARLAATEAEEGFIEKLEQSPEAIYLTKPTKRTPL